MRAFRERDGRYVAELDAAEREVVASVLADVAELLGAGRLEDGPADPAAGPDGPAGADAALWTVRIAPVEPPTDPAVRRLLPDASRDDDEIAAEFRRLTEDDLRARKVARLRALWTVVAHGEPGWPQDALVVDPARAGDVAATLTDVRLVLADRLGVRTDADAQALHASDAADGDDARAYLVALYDALSWLQESLVAVMLAAPGPERPGRGRSAG